MGKESNIIKNCQQVVKPTVDNSKKECDVISSSDCIFVDVDCIKTLTGKGDTLSDFIQHVCIKFAEMEAEIYSLKQMINHEHGTGEDGGDN